MKKALIASVALLFVASYAGAAVIDNFDALGANGNYTATLADTVTNVATGGYEQSAPLAGTGFGMVPTSGEADDHEVQGYIWNGGAQVSSGDTVDLWVGLDSGAFCGGGLVVKTFTGGAYIVGLARSNSGSNIELVSCAQDLAIAAGTGEPPGYWGAGDTLGAFTTQTVGTDTASWYHIVAAYTESGGDNVIDITLTKGTLGNETAVATQQLVDANAARSGAGGFGLWYSEWGNEGVDVDNLGYVPEPATLGLLAVGGVLALLRRRR